MQHQPVSSINLYIFELYFRTDSTVFQINSNKTQWICGERERERERTKKFTITQIKTNGHMYTLCVAHIYRNIETMDNDDDDDDDN